MAEDKEIVNYTAKRSLQSLMATVVGFLVMTYGVTPYGLIATPVLMGVSKSLREATRYRGKTPQWWMKLF